MSREPSAPHPVPSREATLAEALLMMMAVLPVLFSAYVSLSTGDGHWFQRSGGLMVLFSVGVEYHRKYLLRCLESGTPSWLVASSRPARLVTRFWRAVPFICYLSIVVGTLIWSYGDLLFT
ncbi:hypothetical protein FHR95_002793 [Halomonas fontilapidosi]|uniref:Uncharacterized protein n=1 Tax=Halomonas fontilapidosi TaxID=616675 RepID=A0A7W5DLP1_9GAMM|nr:hypothetical protein [Halomonas fontilapidosi]MBB3185212.1 hypothetical protein [Halomonas fontilapidosi]